EQERGEEADARTDLYQLAGSIYWTLTGEYPHGSGTPAEIVARALQGTHRPLRALRSDAPEGPAPVLERELAPRRCRGKGTKRRPQRPPPAEEPPLEERLESPSRDSAGEALASTVGI